MGATNAKSYSPVAGEAGAAELADGSNPAQDSLQEKRRKASIVFASFALLGFLTIAVSLGLVVQAWIWAGDASNDLDAIVASQASECVSVPEYFVLGAQSNFSAVVDIKEEALAITPFSSQRINTPECVVETGQAWILGTNTSEISVLDMLTKRYVDRIDTLRFGCANPTHISYSANASIAAGIGQVWVSCVGSDRFLVFDPVFRTVVRTIDVAAPRGAGDVAVGFGFAVAVLTPDRYAVFDTATFTSTPASIPGVAEINIVHYGDNTPASDVYMYSDSTSRIYQFSVDLETRALTQTGTSGALSPGATDLATSSDDRFLYAAVGTSGVLAFSTGDVATALPGSPFGTVIGPTRFISVSSDGAALGATAPPVGGPYPPHAAVIPIDTTTGVPSGAAAKVYSTYDGVFGIASCPMLCPCSLCHEDVDFCPDDEE